MKKIFGLVLVVLMLAGTAFAVSDSNEAPYLQARYAKINCDARFSIADANSLLAADENAAELSESIETINLNLAALKGYADSGDKANFNTHAVETISAIVSLNAQIRNAVANDLKGPGNREKRVQLRDEHRAQRQLFLECRKNSNLSFALARINAYENILGAWENRIGNFESRGIKVSAMNQIISDARTQIIDPLQDAYDSGDYDTAREAIQTHCLYDGCTSGNFHFAAKIEIAKLDAFLDNVQAAASDANLETEWQSAKDDLNAATTSLEGVSGAKYTSETRSAVWNPIKDAAEKLKTIVQTIRTGGSSE